MNYKELLDKYKQGKLNEKERDVVRQELEKYEAIEMYLAEEMEEALDEPLLLDYLGEGQEESNKIRKSIKNKFRKVIGISVALVVALYVGIFYILSDLIGIFYYNPADITQPKEDAYQSPDFYYDMQAYISLNMPGYTIDSFTFEEEKGFGEYEVSYALENHFTEESHRYFVDFSRGRLTYALDGIFSVENRFEVWKGFESIQNDVNEEAMKRINEQTLNYLEVLNPLSYVSMSIVFNEDLTMEEYYYLSKEENSHLKFQWVGVRTVEPGISWSDSQPLHLIGFNPNTNDESTANRHPDSEEYPVFYLLDRIAHEDLRKESYPESMAKAYEIHLESRLQYIRDREAFVKLFDYNDYKVDFYESALQYIDEHGVKTYGVLVFGTAEELLASMSQIPYESIYINEVLPIKPNMYYD